MPETIALFGATGSTGSHILQLALEQGYQVRVLVRTPSKIVVKHTGLTVVEGDFSNDTAIATTLTGADYVICTAGDKNAPADLMTNFVEKLYKALPTPPPKAFVYQSGAFAPKPDGSNPFFLKFMRYTAAWMLGLSNMVTDNEQVGKFVAANKLEGMRVTVTRPGGLTEEGSGKKLKASNDFEMGMISFKDLAVFTLQVMNDESLDGEFPFVAVVKE